jgi:beta-lactamase class A
MRLKSQMRISLVLFAVASAFGAENGLSRLEQQVAYLARTTDAAVGVSATHIESGRSVSVRGAEAFPMASAFKLPVAVQALTLVDEGKLNLDRMVTLTPQDLHPGSGELIDLMFHPGLAMSVENLMELMLAISDNSAADLVLREAGGPAVVTARMRALGFNAIRVDRPTVLLIAAWQGLKMVPPESDWNRNIWDKLFDGVPEAEHMRARRAETADPRDTATPDEMTRLLVRLWKRELLSAKSTGELIGMLDRVRTGKGRLKGMLPQGTEVGHKTGTLGGVANDAGFMTLPGEAGHVALSVFTKGSSRPEEVSEKTIAEIARTVYDYFTLAETGPPR